MLSECLNLIQFYFENKLKLNYFRIRRVIFLVHNNKTNQNS